MSKKPFKNRAMKATWYDLESESEEKVDTANVCFMANGDYASKVQSEPFIDDAEIIFE